MNLKTVTKRSGHTVPYNREKIYNAIAGANNDGGHKMSEKDIDEVTSQVEWDIQDRENVSVEEIQDIVEQELMKYDFYDIAKKYITYRQKHAERRIAQKHLMSSYRDIFFADAVDVDSKRDNANINTDASMGIMLKLGAEGAKHFVDNYVLTDEFREADKENWIHIHDKDFSLITFNCCQIDLLKLFKGGFSTGHGFLREPNSIRSYASLAAIAIQSNQNDMFGGQAINAFDYAMADGVRKSFRKAVISESHKALMYQFDTHDFGTEKEFKTHFKPAMDFAACSYTESQADPKAAASIDAIKAALETVLSETYQLPNDEAERLARNVYRLACADVVEETHQAMEAMIHNFNTLHSRAGAQVPFSSLNYGMDTSPEGRLATREVLNAIWAGLGNGETPIFPISVFQLKAGVNYNPEDPNYDLFQQACKTSAKRLFPNFVNIDAPYNLQYYKPGDYNSTVATMGCRTRVMSNVNGPEESGSRGNFAFTTLNLPKFALEAKGDMDKFWQLLDKYIEVSHDYILARLDVIADKHVYNYPFLMGQGVWMDSEKLKSDDSIKDVLKHASYSVGFCGLAECLKALVGKHHGESAEAQELGLKIVGHIRERMDKYTAEEHMNWSCFGTPAESTAGQFQRSNRKQYGVIEGITDRDYMTNSSHVPVYYPIKAIDKIRIEAPYHALENAGHIAYIEMDGDPTKNVKAFERLVRAMHDADMGYFSINHPVDRDPVCGYTGLIENECPHCHRKEVESGRFTIKRMK
ncbi:putative anaerobic ribonucleoside-triphosphate reductase [Selenomonas ruminantium subsp. lactilytica TAM6421]|uniref:Putative anaerobic ribonucleoside-triphosphate reductase n=1 Tax=Selenomonas ruminantium subsp. lactilytica (strain NBRC 103574 / TAM6421) TaxID=927704 RepID=I0GNZ7_SELRL|nr:anaerobic ribonucleoside triphosphate reductase [Selenomonas ruminantium]BAL82484.1 putative anaerobic ribonucleoside-triphosphate reductase [Selenomonas ruminantium subsp. lactilytica TAM6421]